MSAIGAAINKRSCGMEEVDRISNLPLDLTHKILEFLPLQEAVKTSVLSQNWRFKWTSIPQLIIGFPCLVYLKLGGYYNRDTPKNNEVLETLISRCPQFESLYLDIHEEMGLTIHAPKLKKLSVSGYIDSLCLEENMAINALGLEIVFQLIAAKSLIHFFALEAMRYCRASPNAELKIKTVYERRTGWLTL
ncbi:putative F-box/FBD/LRR-repeat protein At4g13965 [Chenopodium quinoa]|uniref:putative F-box/FBD/LRR-repeat protein At4g13965 n=1 Tax=Chenopodium quinoa TaxID=63459 RepID=UPI000B7774D1|nr:putative F-box/FBD/LRR-repeat protein At4g13965 [Chenopodium quinoa]